MHTIVAAGARFAGFDGTHTNGASYPNGSATVAFVRFAAPVFVAVIV